MAELNMDYKEKFSSCATPSSYERAHTVNLRGLLLVFTFFHAQQEKGIGLHLQYRPFAGRRTTGNLIF